jgi:hypothetical protein
MSFVPGNRLEETMVRAVDDTTARVDFYRLLLECELFVVGDIKGGAAGQTEVPLAETEGLQIETITYQNKTYHPLFSSQERLRAFVRQPVRYFSMQGRALFECTRGASFLLNPGSELSKIMTPEEIDYTLDHAMQEKPVNIVMSSPEVYPKKLVQALCVLFTSRSQVTSARLSYVSREGDGGAPHPLVAIEAEGDAQTLAQEIFAAAAIAMPGVVVDVVGVDPKTKSDPFRVQLLGVAPFYRRTLPSNFN